jgi:Tfp pilus assembly protein PilF
VGAVNKYNLAALSDPWNPDVRCSHSGLLAMHGDEEAARALLRQALQIDPTHADSLCALALLLMRHRNLAGAEDHYRRALEAHSDHVPSMYQYGMMLDDCGKHQAAEILCARRLARLPI